MDLRKEFFKEMCKLAEKDKDVILLVGDLGYSFMEEYAERFPEQFINAGIAEQNMIGVAAGLALGGKKPYVYSGSIFALMRPYEFVRDDVAYNNLDVKIIGTGANSFLGFTHVMNPPNEDELILKHLPNIQMIFPKDEEQLLCALLNQGPTYIRI